MNEKETTAYLRASAAVFCKPGTERVAALCTALGHPQDSLRCVHVTGTNGKGSFCAMLSAVLQAAGYRVGVFSSPAIQRRNQQITVDGQPISDEELAVEMTAIRPIAEQLGDPPTEFELLTVAAFAYFRRRCCDVAIVETGMGARLDATNVMRRPLLSVITGVAMDHTAFLGDTIEKIAAEKAGVIKDGRPVLFGGEDAVAEAVILAAAREKGAPFCRVERDTLRIHRADLNGTCFSYEAYENVILSLLGLYQPYNAATVLTAIPLLCGQGLQISPAAVRKGLSSVKWEGRFELLSREPTVIFDGAHNAEGVAAAVKSIRHYFSDTAVYVLTGVLRDKDYHVIAADLAQVASRAFVLTPDNPRALAAAEYAAVLQAQGVPATAYATVADAWQAAYAAAQANGVPLVCLGSLYTYASLFR